MIKRILVSVPQAPDGSGEAHFALDLARRHGAGISGFTSVDAEKIQQGLSSSVGFFSYKIKLIADTIESAHGEARKAMEAFGDLCIMEGIEFSPLATSGDADTDLAEVWRFQDLCVMSTRPWEAGNDEAGDGSAVLHLVAIGMRPIIAIPPGAAHKAPEKVMVALSGSLDSAKAMKHFVQLGLYPEVPVHAVVVGKPKSSESAERLLEAASSYLEAHGHPVSVAALEKTDHRTSLLLAEAGRNGAGLIVIGSSYKKFLAAKRFGKHAVQLLDDTTVPVFISH